MADDKSTELIKQGEQALKGRGEIWLPIRGYEGLYESKSYMEVCRCQIKI